MGTRLLQYGPDASVSDAALLYAHGTEFSDQEFAEAFNYKGLHDSASTRSSAMRGYGLLRAYKGIRELTDLALEVLHPTSLEPLIYASSRPACHRQAWSDIVRMGERRFKPNPQHPGFSQALYGSSLKVRFLKGNDTWDHEAISQALKAGYDRSWAKDVADQTQVVPAKESEPLLIEDELRGLQVEFFPDMPGVFPEPMLEQDLWFAREPLPGYTCNTKRWILKATQPLDVRACKQAYRTFLAMKESLENG